MTLALLDTNTYLRLAKRIRPLLGMEFGQKPYVLTVLEDVEDEVRRNRTLQFKFPWLNWAWRSTTGGEHAGALAGIVKQLVCVAQDARRKG